MRIAIADMALQETPLVSKAAIIAIARVTFVLRCTKSQPMANSE